MTTTTQATIESFAECKAGLKTILGDTDDRKLRQLINAEIARLNLAISYLYHRSRR